MKKRYLKKAIGEEIMFTRIKAFFMSLIMLITAAFPSIFGGTNKNVQEESLIRPETWAAVDGLGRTRILNGMNIDDKHRDQSRFYYELDEEFFRKYRSYGFDIIRLVNNKTTHCMPSFCL